MIGTKKLADIKKELREKFKKDRKGVQGWVNEKKAGLASRGSQDLRVLEELMWVEKLLREALEEKGKKPKRSKKRKNKEPVV